MKIVAIIQARMGSTRLPGKVLLTIAGKPILGYVLERVLSCHSIHHVVVATSDQPEDIPIISFAEALDVSVFRGSENDVLDRYYQTARFFEADIIVRLTADCPLLDPVEIDRVVYYFLANPQLDYSALGRTYPEGYGVEVFRIETLQRTWQEARLLSEREHVTPYIWKHVELFNIERLELPWDYSGFRVTIDEAIDIPVVTKLIEVLSTNSRLFGLYDVVSYLKDHPEIASLNKDIPYQAGYQDSLKLDNKSVVENE